MINFCCCQVKLAESLLGAEKHSQVASPVNRYRKYLGTFRNPKQLCER